MAEQGREKNEARARRTTNALWFLCTKCATASGVDKERGKGLT
jgi:hypothetical protein